MPPGSFFIIANETAERFSFYGMKSILVMYIENYMHDAAGQAVTMTEASAREYYHVFVMATYATPLVGALVAEVVLGKYRTIMIFSIVYCASHLALAVSETPPGLVIGLALISLGAGGIKPCITLRTTTTALQYCLQAYKHVSANAVHFASVIAA